MTAEGTAQDPGDRIVLADEAGALLTLADEIDPTDATPPDVTVLESAAADTPWMLEHALDARDPCPRPS